MLNLALSSPHRIWQILVTTPPRDRTETSHTPRLEMRSDHLTEELEDHTLPSHRLLPPAETHIMVRAIRIIKFYNKN